MPFRSKEGPASPPRPTQACRRCHHPSRHLDTDGVCRRHREVVHVHYHFYYNTGSDPHDIVSQLRDTRQLPSFIELPSDTASTAHQRRPQFGFGAGQPPPVNPDTKPTWTRRS
ncbi:hypothetical protein FE257_002835 [Aspergillus nanangensis]|uniref:Uncharacterized protein n=1 Tax=Aspergillus nanangensis TaxID=2582783 RepID=A0AAD4GN45_ASPNN|nr:hypothetical protein FE257_002835 [Aspergillus nanangensis]